MDTVLWTESRDETGGRGGAQAAGEARELGLKAWQVQRDALPVVEPGGSREDQMGAERLRDQYDREQEAIDRTLAAHPAPVDREQGEVTAVVAHRHSWVVGKLAGQLALRGVEVVAAVEDVTLATAALVVHQPDLLVLSDRLLGGPGLELVERARELSAGTRAVVQVDVDGRWPEAREAGAVCVVSHRASVEELAATALAAVTG